MKKRVFAFLLSLLMPALTLTACGGAKNSSGSTSAAMDMATTESAPKDDFMMMETEESLADMDYGGDAKYDNSTGTGGAGQEQGAPPAASRKFIVTAWLELETTGFEEAVQGLTQLTEDFGGYFESSSVANRTSGSRWASYTARIPAAQYKAYMNQAGSLCHETWREATEDDITEAYYDTQGRLKTQQIKLERLQELLSKAELMEDIITIESAISETEWQIDELSGTLRHYDSKVDYATIHITLSEVYRLSNVETVPESFGERMSDAFSDGLRSFSRTMENLAVGFAYSWMWWLLLAVVVAVIVVMVRRGRAARPAGEKKAPFWSRRRKKQDDKPE